MENSSLEVGSLPSSVLRFPFLSQSRFASCSVSGVFPPRSLLALPVVPREAPRAPRRFPPLVIFSARTQCAELRHSHPQLSTTFPGQSNIIFWNKKLSKYAKAGQYEKIMGVFQQMQREGMSPTTYSFVPVLNACSHLRALEDGRRIHAQVIESGCDSDVFVGNALVDMYAKCGSIEDALGVFYRMPARDVISWNAMIHGYVKCGKGQKALEISWQMYREGVEPTPVTFVGLLNACACIGALEEGHLIHEQIIQSGYLSNIFVASSLVDMYTKCGSTEDAWRVFKKMGTRDVVAWTTMIQAYVKSGKGWKALDLFRQMREEGVKPNPVTVVAVLNACASVSALEVGMHAHEEIIRAGWESDVFVSAGLVDMYAKCGSIDDAWRVFQTMSTRDVVSWSSMIQGYLKCGQALKALELYKWMQFERVEPNLSTFIGVLNACASVSALEEGRAVHELISRRGLMSDFSVGSSLINMYAKCGSLEDALRVFGILPKRDGVTWTAMIAGYAFHGQANEALELFKRMCNEGVEMDAVTFVSLLSACSHGGLVDDGMHYFESMISDYNIPPTMDHYACIVDLLGRAGRLHEAEDLIRSMSCQPDVSLWMCLLGACKVHCNFEIGQRAAKEVQRLDPGNSAGHLLLSNMYATAGKVDKSLLGTED